MVRTSPTTLVIGEKSVSQSGEHISCRRLRWGRKTKIWPRISAVAGELIRGDVPRRAWLAHAHTRGTVTWRDPNHGTRKHTPARAHASCQQTRPLLVFVTTEKLTPLLFQAILNTETRKLYKYRYVAQPCWFSCIVSLIFIRVSIRNQNDMWFVFPSRVRKWAAEIIPLLFYLQIHRNEFFLVAC